MVVFQVKNGCTIILGNWQIYGMKYFLLKIFLNHKMLKIPGFSFKIPGFSCFWANSRLFSPGRVRYKIEGFQDFPGSVGALLGCGHIRQLWVMMWPVTLQREKLQHLVNTSSSKYLYSLNKYRFNSSWVRTHNYATIKLRILGNQFC